MPAGASAFAAGISSSSSPARDLAKRKMKIEFSAGVNAAVLDLALLETVAKLGFHVVRHMQQDSAKILLDAQLFRERSS
jgi:hypothetical protein